MKNAGPESKEISDGDPVGLGRVFPLPHSSARPLHPPPQIPDYELHRCIGRGSYGEVWLARTVLGQYRAVKVVYRDAFEHDRPFNREYEGIQKFEPISRSHSSQLAILHVGRNDEAGYFYYVMELADDASIQAVGADVSPQMTSLSKLKSRDLRSSPEANRILKNAATYIPKTLKYLLHERDRLPFEECLQIGIALTTALEHLHKHDLVHRDIKPSNIVFVNGVLKLADIGLVASTDATMSFVGTSGFLPPEGPGTPQADLYSLGKVLYEISTGRDRQEFPKLPPDLAELEDSQSILELNAVILKACATNPRERYQCAEAMRADLALLVRGESVRGHHICQKRLCAARKVILPMALVILTSTFIFLAVHPHREGFSNNLLANKEYSEGLHCYRRDTGEGLRQGLAHFLKAIEIDPKFTMAYNGLFEVYANGEGLELSQAETDAKLRATGERMMALDASLAEAHAAQGWIDFLDWKWDEAERRFKRAIQLNSKCAIAHMRYGFCLVHWGRIDEGHQHLSQAEMLDPALPRIKKNLGHVFYAKRQFPAAINQYRKSIRLEPNYPVAHAFIGKAWLAQGEYLKAIEEFQINEILIGEDPKTVRQKWGELRLAYETSGPPGFWSKYLEMAEEKRYLYRMAVCHAHLRNYDEALRLLEEVYAKREPDSLEYLFFDECWDSVRSDSRFSVLLKKVGFRK